MWRLSTESGQTRTCGHCRHFIDDPEVLERELPGLLILSSAMGDTRGNQGLCSFHEQILTPDMTCECFWARNQG